VDNSTFTLGCRQISIHTHYLFPLESLLGKLSGWCRRLGRTPPFSLSQLTHIDNMLSCVLAPFTVTAYRLYLPAWHVYMFFLRLFFHCIVLRRAIANFHFHLFVPRGTFIIWSVSSRPRGEQTLGFQSPGQMCMPFHKAYAMNLPCFIFILSGGEDI